MYNPFFKTRIANCESEDEVKNQNEPNASPGENKKKVIIRNHQRGEDFKQMILK